MVGDRLFAGYLFAQALVGIALWITWGTSDMVRSWFELMEGAPAVTDAFVLADLFVGVLGSGLGGWALLRSRRWAVPVVCFTAGGMVYPTLYLVAWVSFEATGALCLTIMVPPSILTTYVAWQVWRRHR